MQPNKMVSASTIQTDIKEVASIMSPGLTEVYQHKQKGRLLRCDLSQFGQRLLKDGVLSVNSSCFQKMYSRRFLWVLTTEECEQSVQDLDPLALAEYSREESRKKGWRETDSRRKEVEEVNGLEVGKKQSQQAWKSRPQPQKHCPTSTCVRV